MVIISDLHCLSASDDCRRPEDQEQAPQEEAAVREHEHGALQGRDKSSLYNHVNCYF